MFFHVIFIIHKEIEEGFFIIMLCYCYLCIQLLNSDRPTSKMYNKRETKKSMILPCCIRFRRKRFSVDVPDGWNSTRQRRRNRIVPIHNGIAVRVFHRFHRHTAAGAAADVMVLVIRAF